MGRGWGRRKERGWEGDEEEETTRKGEGKEECNRKEERKGDGEEKGFGKKNE